MVYFFGFLLKLKILLQYTIKYRFFKCNLFINVKNAQGKQVCEKVYFSGVDDVI